MILTGGGALLDHVHHCHHEAKSSIDCSLHYMHNSYLLYNHQYMWAGEETRETQHLIPDNRLGRGNPSQTSVSRQLARSPITNAGYSPAQTTENTRIYRFTKRVRTLYSFQQQTTSQTTNTPSQGLITRLHDSSPTHFQWRSKYAFTNGNVQSVAAKSNTKAINCALCVHLAVVRPRHLLKLKA